MAKLKHLRTKESLGYIMASTDPTPKRECETPFSRHTLSNDEEKVLLYDSLPDSLETSDSARNFSELNLYEPELPTSKMLVDSPDEKYAWTSGILTRFPWFGILPLLSSMICEYYHSTLVPHAT